MIQVDLQNAEKRFRELIELASSGEDVVISQDNEPLVKLASVVRQKRQRQFGSAKGLIVMAEDFDAPLEDMREYMYFTPSLSL